MWQIYNYLQLRTNKTLQYTLIFIVFFVKYFSSLSLLSHVKKNDMLYSPQIDPKIYA